MSAMQIFMLVLILLIVVPMPLAWLVGTLFPNGYTRAHAQRVGELFRKEWKRVLLCGVVILVLLVVFPRGDSVRFILIAVAVLMGRMVAVGRNK